MVAIFALIGWYLFFRNPNIPVEEAVRNILPFGSAPTPSGVGVPTSDPTGASEEIDARPTTNLFRISSTPVAGAVIFTKNNQTIVRYVDRATGHIYDTDLAMLVKTKVANQTLPKIYEAYFRPDGNAVLLRSLKEDSDVVENIVLTLTPPKSISTDALYTVSSAALRGDIGAVATADSGNTLFYALRDTSTINSSAFNGTGAKTLLASPFTDWRLAVAGNNLVVYTKASAGAAGYAYTLNTASRAFTKILGPFNGLAVVPNKADNRVLYSYFENDGTRLFVKNLVNNALSEILPTTLAEKCVWSAKNIGTFFCGTPTAGITGAEPDNWYKGATHFSDYIWRFDTNSEVAQLLSEPKRSFGVDIDVIDPKLSPDENYLVFINKTDLSLWALKLEQF